MASSSLSEDDFLFDSNGAGYQAGIVSGIRGGSPDYPEELSEEEQPYEGYSLCLNDSLINITLSSIFCSKNFTYSYKENVSKPRKPIYFLDKTLMPQNE